MGLTSILETTPKFSSLKRETPAQEEPNKTVIIKTPGTKKSI